MVESQEIKKRLPDPQSGQAGETDEEFINRLMTIIGAKKEVFEAEKYKIDELESRIKWRFMEHMEKPFERELKDVIDDQQTENLQCSICYQVLLDPRDCLKCEKAYCNKCITKHLKRNKTCPNCRAEHTIRERQSIRIQEQLQMLMVRCSKCKEKVKYFDYKHQWVCKKPWNYSCNICGQVTTIFKLDKGMTIEQSKERMYEEQQYHQKNCFKDLRDHYKPLSVAYNELRNAIRQYEDEVNTYLGAIKTKVDAVDLPKNLD